MMNVLKTFLRDHADGMVRELRQLGFTRSQAQDFLAENITQIMSILQSQAELMDLSGESESHLTSLLTDKIQLPGITSRLQIDADTAANGLRVILPIIVRGLIDKSKAARTKKPSKAVLTQTKSHAKTLDSKH